MLPEREETKGKHALAKLSPEQSIREEEREVLRERKCLKAERMRGEDIIFRLAAQEVSAWSEEKGAEKRKGGAEAGYELHVWGGHPTCDDPS